MAAGTYYFGWIKSWSNSNSLAFGAPFLTYLLLESESESESPPIRQRPRHPMAVVVHVWRILIPF